MHVLFLCLVFISRFITAIQVDGIQAASKMASHILGEIAEKGKRKLIDMQSSAKREKEAELAGIARERRAANEYLLPLRKLPITYAVSNLEALLRSDEVALSNFHARINVCHFMYPFVDPEDFIDALKGYGLTMIEPNNVITCAKCNASAKEKSHMLCWKNDVGSCPCESVDSDWMHSSFSVRNTWSSVKQAAEKATIPCGELCGKCADEWVARYARE